MKRVIERASVTTLSELKEFVEYMSKEYAPADAVYVSINSESVRLTLVAETLTDGSVVCNIELSPVPEAI